MVTRSASEASTSTSRSTGRPWAAAPLRADGAAARSSTSVPHALHAEQRPSHFPVVYPHSEHAYWIAAALAMPSSLGRR